MAKNIVIYDSLQKAATETSKVSTSIKNQISLLEDAASELKRISSKHDDCFNIDSSDIDNLIKEINNLSVAINNITIVAENAYNAFQSAEKKQIDSLKELITTKIVSLKNDNKFKSLNLYSIDVYLTRAEYDEKFNPQPKSTTSIPTETTVSGGAYTVSLPKPQFVVSPTIISSEPSQSYAPLISEPIEQPQQPVSYEPLTATPVKNEEPKKESKEEINKETKEVKKQSKNKTNKEVNKEKKEESKKDNKQEVNKDAKKPINQENKNEVNQEPKQENKPVNKTVTPLQSEGIKKSENVVTNKSESYTVPIVDKNNSVNNINQAPPNNYVINERPTYQSSSSPSVDPPKQQETPKVEEPTKIETPIVEESTPVIEETSNEIIEDLLIDDNFETPTITESYDGTKDNGGSFAIPIGIGLAAAGTAAGATVLANKKKKENEETEYQDEIVEEDLNNLPDGDEEQGEPIFFDDKYDDI